MMNRQELVELMSKAGFNTDWLGYEDARETVSKYERFAELIERKLIDTPFSGQDTEKNNFPRG